MSVAAVVRRRRMVRRYAGKPVDPAVVESLLHLGTRAPSAGFSQGVSFLALTQTGSVQRFWELTASGESAWLRGMRTAPVLVLVWCSQDAYLDRYAEPDKGWTDRDEARWTAPYWFVDAGMAAENILLGAVEAGLGACFFGVPPERVDAVREAFGVPSEQLSVGVISLGHPAEASVSGSAATRPRRTRESVVHKEAW